MVGTMKERLDALDQLYPVWEKHTLWSFFQKNCARFSDREFLIFEDEILTYGQTLRWVERTALGLYALGVRPGDHVALFLHNRPEFAILIFALSKVGAVKIPVNAGLKEEELSYVLERSDASFLISESPLGTDLIGRLPCLRRAVIFAETAPDDGIHIPWDAMLNLAWEGDVARAEASFVACQDPDSLSDIMFTSGSTSRPKGVMMTHDMLLRSGYSTARTRCMEMGRRIYIPIPLFHAFAYVEGLLALLSVGGAAIMSREKFRVEHGLALMRTYRANDIICVSPIMINILSSGRLVPEEYPDMHAAYWAAACPAWTWEHAKKAFLISDVGTGYGMTECGSTTTITRPCDPSERLGTYHGRLKDGGCASDPDLDGHVLQVKICSGESGAELPVGESGEIVVRGLTVTPGYYNDPVANAAAFDSEGWFHTGDVGSLDEEGFLSFQGRVDDMYKVNGENVSPRFVESVISQAPNVTAVEVVGVIHPKYGQVGVAFVDAKEVSKEANAALKQFCKAHLARFQCPYRFFLGDNNAWPRTGTGKIQKSRLREIAERRIEGEQMDSLTGECICFSLL